MAHDIVNGRIYSTSTSGIDATGDVAPVLNADTGDWKALCTNTGINKYAKFRPIERDTHLELTEAQRQDSNCGIDCSDTSTGCFSTSLKSLLDRAKALNDWTRILPSTNYRITDFDGYYKNARAPFRQTENIAGNVTSPTSQEQIWQRVPVIAQTDTYNSHQENLRPGDLVGALTSGGRTLASYKFAYIYRNVSTPSATPSIASVDTAGGQTIDSFIGYANPVSFAPPSSYASPVTYDVVFIAYHLSGGSYWATFFPKTYCQLKLALFSVFDANNNPIEGQTLQFPASGGIETLRISGYNWGASWSGKGNPDAPILITMTPDQGGTDATWSEVELSVGRANISTFSGYYTTTVILSAPGVSSESPNYAIDFHVRQRCNDKYHEIAYTDSEGNELGNELRLNNNSISWERSFYMTADISWTLTRVVWIDGEGESYDASDQISVTPASASAPSAGQPYKTTTCYITNLVQLTAGRHFQAFFQNTQYGAAYRLNIYAKE